MVSPQNFFRGTVAAMVFVSMMLVLGCTGDLEKRVDDLEDRVSSLEQLTEELDTQAKAGSLLSSVTPIAGDGGWTLEFSNGETITVDNAPAPGAPGITPKIELREENGGVYLYYNITSGYPASGWVRMGSNLRGPQGPTGDSGSSGTPGTPGTPGTSGTPGDDATVKLRVNASDADADVITIQFSTDGGSSWTDITGVTLPFNPVAPFLAIVKNTDGTVTFTMNDGDATTYTFALFSTAQHFEIMSSVIEVISIMVDTDPNPDDNVHVWVSEDRSVVKTRFRVNPSSAYIPSGNSAEALANWEVDLIGSTRSGYVTPTDAFELTNIQAGITGEYIAWLECVDGIYDDQTKYTLALVLNNGGNQISSGTFTPEDVPLTDMQFIAGAQATLEGTPWPAGHKSINIFDYIEFTPATAGDTALDFTITDVVAPTPPATEVVHVVENSGHIYAISPGVVDITITSEKYSSLTLTFRVEVEAESVTGVTLSSSKIYIPIGGDVTLTAVVTPSTALNKNMSTWVIDSPSIATVDYSGNPLAGLGYTSAMKGAVITGLSVGTATITVTADDTTNGPITETCDIEVYDPTAIVLADPDKVLINGIWWAQRNVGVAGSFTATPYEAGLHYQYYNTTGYDENYTAQLAPVDFGPVPQATWDEGPCPTGYWIPYVSDFESLFNDPSAVSYDFVIEDGVPGARFRDLTLDPLVNTMFLPAAGYRTNFSSTSDVSDPSGGYYFTSEPSDVPSSSYVNRLNFHQDNISVGSQNVRTVAMTIRCMYDYE